MSSSIRSPDARATTSRATRTADTLERKAPAMDPAEVAPASGPKATRETQQRTRAQAVGREHALRAALVHGAEATQARARFMTLEARARAALGGDRDGTALDERKRAASAVIDAVLGEGASEMGDAALHAAGRNLALEMDLAASGCLSADERAKLQPKIDALKAIEDLKLIRANEEAAQAARDLADAKTPTERAKALAAFAKSIKDLADALDDHASARGRIARLEQRLDSACSPTSLPRAPGVPAAEPRTQGQSHEQPGGRPGADTDVVVRLPVILHARS